jgi:hypothetical protein
MNNTCAPTNSKNSYTCFTNESLVEIANAYNKENPNNKINIPKLFTSRNRHNLWLNIKKAMKRYTPCDADFCLLETDILKKNADIDDLQEDFKPEKPMEWYKNNRTWLSNIDIDEVMSQYEKDTDFEFIGPVPIDFDYKTNNLFGSCIVNELCNLNLEELIKRGKTKLGVIFNLDPHYMSGSHWTALFSDFNKGGIYYFDSYGTQPGEEVIKLMQRINTQGNDLIRNKKIDINKMDNEHSLIRKYSLYDEQPDILVINDKYKDLQINCPIYIMNNPNELIVDNNKFNCISNKNKYVLKTMLPIDKDAPKEGTVLCKGFQCFYNDHRFQFKNSECGVYSMHFIIEFLNGKKFQDIIDNVIDDDSINKKRDIFYRDNIIKKIKKSEL